MKYDIFLAEQAYFEEGVIMIKRKNPQLFSYIFEIFICIRVITVQISIPALSSPAQRAVFCQL